MHLSLDAPPGECRTPTTCLLPSGNPGTSREDRAMTQKVERWRGIASAALGLSVIPGAGPASATHDEPGRGKALRTALVTAYKQCTSPNTVTQGGLPQPACS